MQKRMTHSLTNLSAWAVSPFLRSESIHEDGEHNIRSRKKDGGLLEGDTSGKTYSRTSRRAKGRAQHCLLIHLFLGNERG